MFLPLSDSELLDFIDNQDNVFEIDFSKNQLDYPTSFAYLSNLGMRCNIDFSSIEKEQKFEIIKYYMESEVIVHIENLEKLVLQIYLQYKGIQIEEFKSDILSTEEIEDFLTINENLLDKYDQVLSSIFLYMLLTFKTEEERSELKEACEINKDQNFIGLNFINLFKYQEFYGLFLLHEPKYSIYFEPYFEKYMFEGYNLFNFLNNENNILMKTFSVILNPEDGKNVSPV